MGCGIDDAVALFEAMAPPFLEPGRAAKPSRMVLLDDPLFEAAEQPILAARAAWLESLPHPPGAPAGHVRSLVPLASILDLNRTIVGYEIGRLYGCLVETDAAIDPALAAAIVEGAAISDEAYHEAPAGAGHIAAGGSSGPV